ncbi:NADPH-dependent ferric siderophore reductase [Mumia flava]|uniref:NADPH-dependent ferric siderophore reductase n=1 Tax=Mumia flava TaxID=1348852 RepID=A0A0B2BUI2_9ACTN|nr:siderophore-interacting protein [Mumia flava]PJJ57052.1 NADPH-dependent ferric siderophore reductase [Mumia flava]
MARTNVATHRTKPQTPGLITLHVLRSERISPSFVRVTLGAGDIEQFVPLGADQWFRLGIPVTDEDSLTRLPNKLDTVAYLKYLTISKATRPILRNYTVRAYRPDGPDGPELDVDFVVHGSVDDPAAGPAATWAQTCEQGDPVALIDEGTMFALPDGRRRVLLVADETGLPATAGILASLPRDAVGHALIEVPTIQDAQAVDAPDDIEVTWLPRTDPHAVPGQAALAAAMQLPVSDEPTLTWVVGEQKLPSSLRRHLVKAGTDKADVIFCGYWKAG